MSFSKIASSVRRANPEIQIPQVAEKKTKGSRQ